MLNEIQALPSAGNHPPSAAAGPLILLVDDNHTNLRVLSSYLCKRNYRVLQAEAGLQALQIAAETQPHLVLLDVMMPGIDGFETCRRLKDDPLTSQIPVIFMTALTDTENKLAGFQAGGVDYLTKPIHLEELRVRMQTHLTLRNLQAELKTVNQSLEQRVADRTRRLQATATASRQLNEIRDRNQLLARLTHYLKEQFGFYYAHVYLLDEPAGLLNMVEGTDEAGQKLKTRGHRMKLGEGIVGLVAQRNAHILCNDVRHSAEFVPNDLLPHTRAELAVPIRQDKHVIGVLDIQSDQTDSFTSEDVELLQTIANGTGTALENIRLLQTREAAIAELHALDRAKSEFLSMISHELRTPLTTVLGFSELILNGISGEVSAKIKHQVGHIHTSGHHLLTLITDILDLTNMAAGEFELQQEVISDYAGLLADVGQGLQDLIDPDQIKLQIAVAPDLPPMYADPLRVRQILLNLGRNAIKYTSRGYITFTAEPNPDDPDFVRFSVSDTGIGIPSEHQDHIFSAFHLQDASNTRFYDGLGLGLTLCRELVRHHGGRIGLESQARAGSRFHFTLPIAH